MLKSLSAAAVLLLAAAPGCAQQAPPTGDELRIGNGQGGIVVDPRITVSNHTLITPGVSAQYINGVPQADQFPGADMCVKLRAANLYAVANRITYVDATHFLAAQNCSVDPVQALAPTGTTVSLTDRLPGVAIDSTVPWRITNPGVTLEGMSPQTTWLRYTGTTNVAAVLTLESLTFAGTAATAIPPYSGTLMGVNIRNMAVLANNNATDGIFAGAWHRSELFNVWTWGMKGCGIHTYFAVTDTFYRPHTSGQDSVQYPFGGARPQSGLCLDGARNMQTTDGTIVDAITENVKGAGWRLINANNMTFTGGTSESNGNGVEVDGPSGFNTFATVDLEGNSENNFSDYGVSTKLLNSVLDFKPTHLYNTSRYFREEGGNITSKFIVDRGATAYMYDYGNQSIYPQEFEGGAAFDAPSRAKTFTVDSLHLGPDTRPTITSSVGKPRDPCQSGSLYVNASGGAGSTLFVCEASAWVAK